MTTPLEVTSSTAGAPPEAALVGLGQKAIQGRSLGQIAWMRLKRDKVAVTGGIIVLVLLVIAMSAFVLDKMLGVIDPNEFHQDLIDTSTLAPKGTFGGMSWEHPLGVEPLNGRDILLRIYAGSWISLLIAFLATLLSVLIGTTMGVISGYFGGWVDTMISRLMDIFLAFPLLVFAIALVAVMSGVDTLWGFSGDSLRIGLLVFIIGFFNWPYIGRIVRGQTLSLREREFVDAARSLGARGRYILFREMLPNLMAPILVYATLLIPTNILFEAALSFLGVGIRPPTPTWGGMLSEAVRYYTIPHFVLWPGLAIFVTVLSFNLFGDGLRDALDPRSR
jgi:peptide/nickel transport system permease protein